MLRSELPFVIFDGLDSPAELFTQGLGKELLDGNVKLLGEDDSEAWVNIVLYPVSNGFPPVTWA